MIPERPDWSPFVLAPEGVRAPAPRSIATREGVGDRLRAAAFAEIQARDAFFRGAERFAHAAPEPLCGAWRSLARAEQKHLDWLMARMGELGIDVRERPVSDQLWRSLEACASPREFAVYMANAEERGRRAGERFRAELAMRDPVTSAIFGKIAEEEVAHIDLTLRFFPDEALSAARAAEALGAARGVV